MQRRGLLTAAAMSTVLWGCTANFWSLRTGVEGGEVEGSVEATLLWSDGCDDLTVFAINEEESVLLTFEMDGPLSEMHTDKKRLETLILSEDDDFSITLHAFVVTHYHTTFHPIGGLTTRQQEAPPCCPW